MESISSIMMLAAIAAAVLMAASIFLMVLIDLVRTLRAKSMPKNPSVVPVQSQPTSVAQATTVNPTGEKRRIIFRRTLFTVWFNRRGRPSGTIKITRAEVDPSSDAAAAPSTGAVIEPQAVTNVAADTAAVTAATDAVTSPASAESQDAVPLASPPDAPADAPSAPDAAGSSEKEPPLVPPQAPVPPSPATEGPPPTPSAQVTSSSTMGPMPKQTPATTLGVGEGKPEDGPTTGEQNGEAESQGEAEVKVKVKPIASLSEARKIIEEKAKRSTSAPAPPPDVSATDDVASLLGIPADSNVKGVESKPKPQPQPTPKISDKSGSVSSPDLEESKVQNGDEITARFSPDDPAALLERRDASTEAMDISKQLIELKDSLLKLEKKLKSLKHEEV
ncbi:MAG: hypothetical protein WHS82_03510 [Candidatus Methanosuratincola sp.]